MPVSMRTVAPSAFAHGPAETTGFVFKGNWAYNEKEERIVGYSGRGRSVVSDGIVAVGHSCLLGYLPVTKVSFESPSKVVRFDDLAFSRTSLRRVVVPQSIRRLGICQMPLTRTAGVRRGSEFVEIGSWCFEDYSLEHLLVPGNVKSIASSCFTSSSIRTVTSRRFEGRNRWDPLFLEMFS
jgi:hypothetical protein